MSASSSPNACDWLEAAAQTIIAPTLVFGIEQNRGELVPVKRRRLTKKDIPKAEGQQKSACLS